MTFNILNCTLIFAMFVQMLCLIVSFIQNSKENAFMLSLNRVAGEWCSAFRQIMMHSRKMWWIRKFVPPSHESRICCWSLAALASQQLWLTSTIASKCCKSAFWDSVYFLQLCSWERFGILIIVITMSLYKDRGFWNRTITWPLEGI